MHRSLDQKKPHLLILILLHIPLAVETAVLHLDLLDFEHDVMIGQDLENVCVEEGVV